ncbi:MAG TPA: hypothetical protein VIL86_01730 [Tepidisphaeraceae bacterium]|jgi:hypothetical protein
MKSIVLWSLLGLNMLLLVLFLGRSHENAAYAQPAGGGRAGSYIAAPGLINGANTEVVFIVDTRNGFLTLAAQDKGNIQAVRPIDLNRLFK